MSTAPYDPVGEVPITNKLITVKPKSMLNHYRRIVKVGGGQHGTVYLCLKQRKNASDLAVVSFIVGFLYISGVNSCCLRQ